MTPIITTHDVTSFAQDGTRLVRKRFIAERHQAFRNELTAYRILHHRGFAYAPRLVTFDIPNRELVLEEIQGSRPELGTEPELGLRIAHEWGRVAAALHTIKYYPDVDPGAIETRQLDEWLELPKRVAPLLTRVDPRLPRQLELALLHHNASICAPLRLCLLHRDLRLDNLVWAVDGGLVVLDWEHACWGPAPMDLARIIWRELHESAALVAAFRNGYGGEPEVWSHRTVAFFRVVYCLEMLAFLSETGSELGPFAGSIAAGARASAAALDMAEKG